MLESCSQNNLALADHKLLHDIIELRGESQVSICMLQMCCILCLLLYSQFRNFYIYIYSFCCYPQFRNSNIYHSYITSAFFFTSVIHCGPHPMSFVKVGTP